MIRSLQNYTNVVSFAPRVPLTSRARNLPSKPFRPERNGIPLSRAKSGVCSEPGCPNLNPCSDHAGRVRSGEKSRLSASAQGYDATWRRLRKWHLHRFPLCAVCGSTGSGRRSNHVDHIVPLEAGGPRLDPANLQTLCLPHHNEKTAQDRKRYTLR